jgi:hypothetical protein
MEVHHPHHPTHNKKWAEYLLEFLMLFFAVFLGFIAEYQLEHKIERDREREFIVTLISDLRKDTVNITSTIKHLKQKEVELDSLLTLLKLDNRNDYGSAIYYYGRKAIRFQYFSSADQTIQQMKNSGSFRLIKNGKAASKILDYYSDLTFLYYLQNNVDNRVREYSSMVYTIFNPYIFDSMVNKYTNNIINKPTGNPALEKSSKADLNKASMNIHFLKIGYGALYINFNPLKNKATELITLLKKEYKID